MRLRKGRKSKCERFQGVGAAPFWERSHTRSGSRSVISRCDRSDSVNPTQVRKWDAPAQRMPANHDVTRHSGGAQPYLGNPLEQPYQMTGPTSGAQPHSPTTHKTALSHNSGDGLLWRWIDYSGGGLITLEIAHYLWCSHTHGVHFILH